MEFQLKKLLFDPKFYPFYPPTVSDQTYLAINIRVQRHHFSEKIDDFLNFSSKNRFLSPKFHPFFPLEVSKVVSKTQFCVFLLPEQTCLGICINIRVPNHYFSDIFGDFWNFSSKNRFLTPKFHPFCPLDLSKVI